MRTDRCKTCLARIDPEQGSYCYTCSPERFDPLDQTQAPAWLRCCVREGLATRAAKSLKSGHFFCLCNTDRLAELVVERAGAYGYWMVPKDCRDEPHPGGIRPLKWGDEDGGTLFFEPLEGASE